MALLGMGQVSQKVKTFPAVVYYGFNPVPGPIPLGGGVPNYFVRLPLATALFSPTNHTRAFAIIGSHNKIYKIIQNLGALPVVTVPITKYLIEVPVTEVGSWQ